MIIFQKKHRFFKGETCLFTAYYFYEKLVIVKKYWSSWKQQQDVEGGNIQSNF